MALFTGEDGRARCGWCAATPGYVQYHDHEWGFPVTDDIRLFEKLCLEGFQSGLSWRTILEKRENFRAAFAGFDFRKVAEFGPEDVERLLQRGVRGDERVHGHGIGLAIVQDLVKAYRGELAVERSAELGGASFVVRFAPVV